MRLLTKIFISILAPLRKYVHMYGALDVLLIYFTSTIYMKFLEF
jgi:hypothetical protein